MGQKKLYVELLRYSTGVEEVIAMGAKLCYSAADIHSLKNGIEKKDQSAFVKKLMDMGHMSPIEHASFTFGVEGVSRSLLAQITRHRIASFSVQSQRYVGKESHAQEEVFDFIVPPRIMALGKDAVSEYEEQMKTIQGWYNVWQQKLGGNNESANEDARFILPNACETKMMVTMNARELLHFFQVRCCQRAQWEIRALADAMLNLVKQVAPSVFEKAGPPCVAGPCPEGKMSCGKMDEMRRKYSGSEE